MGNNTLQDASSSAGGRKFVIDIPDDLGPYLSTTAFSCEQLCIFKVPKKLREIKPGAYTPRVVSIGPLHHGEVDLKEMEELKLVHLAKFCSRTGKKWTDYEKLIRDSKQRIRKCYDLEENDESHDDGFARMILLDSVFIIELGLKIKDPESYLEDFLLGKPWLSYDILRDLVLLENQLPYFVLEDLYNLALPIGHPSRLCSFFSLACFLVIGFVVSFEIDRMKRRKDPQDCFTWWNCFWMENYKHRKHNDENISETGSRTNPRNILILVELFELEHHQKSNEQRIKHLLDLLRKFRIYRQPMKMCPNARNLYGASFLHKAGVNFNLNPDAWPQQVEFKSGVLTMARFEVQDSTECVIRNLMAFEQCHYPRQPYVCSFISLLDSLINTEEDVDLLVKKGVLVHFLGDNESVAKLLNGLSQEITVTMSPYSPIINRLNEHYENRWYHTVAIMRKVYFNNLWRGTATIAAIMLLFLTFVQTVCSIKQTFF